MLKNLIQSNTINYCKSPKWCLLIQFTSETKNNTILKPRKTTKSQSKGFTLVKGLEPLSFLIF